MNVNQLLSAAKNNDLLANFKLGKYYEENNYLVNAAINSVYFYERSAVLGHADGMYKVASLYEHGYGVRKDINRAIYYYECAARLNHSKATTRLGNIYEMGLGVNPNPQKALNYYQNGCALKDASAMYNLGLCYKNGSLDKKDETKAFEFLSSAAKLNFYLAYIEVAKAKEYGIGTTVDFEESFKYYVLSANIGNVDAMVSAGRIALNVFHNLIEAKKWFIKASSLNNLEAKEMLKELFKKYPFLFG